jgi:ATP-dependent DNA helicase RecQ
LIFSKIFILYFYIFLKIQDLRKAIFLHFDTSYYLYKKMTKEEILKQYFGYDHFRPLQAEIIDHVMASNDALVLMPTGGGKSVCYQVPALLFDGLTVVISPLIALMQDQVRNLRSIGVPAAFVNSTLSAKEQYEIEQQCQKNILKLLYISPEKLLTPGYSSFLKSLKISLFAIDEAHCVSVWGHDFRPEYTQLHLLKREFGTVPIIALTATADKVTRRDILSQLNIPQAEVFTSSFDRPNLSLTVLPGRNRLRAIDLFLKRKKGQSGIIYCLSRNNTESVAGALKKLGYKAEFYHAGIPHEQRTHIQESFVRDEVEIIVATVAFGMGIDKPNVRFVIHYNLPNNVESYYQEIGRGGRDGLPADTLLFYSYQDVMMRLTMLQDSEMSLEMKALQEAKLERMKQYAEAEICRRRILISYFNEDVEKDCGNCDVCRNPPQRFDGTVIAQKALSAVARTNEQVSMTTLVDILRGSQNRQILSKGYHTLKTFGAGRDLRNEEWTEYLLQMLNGGIMDIDYQDGHNYKLNNASWAVLKEGRKVPLVRFTSYKERQAKQAETQTKEKTTTEAYSEELLTKLKTLRRQLADAQNIPAFVVFSDATLLDMTQKQPRNLAQMQGVSGVGEKKMEQYGAVFLEEIRRFYQDSSQYDIPKTKASTYQQTLEMHQQGLSVKEISRARQLSETTIWGHLAKLLQEGEAIAWETLLTKQQVSEIQAKAEELGIGPEAALKPLFEALGERYGYGVLRLVLVIPS